MPRLSRRSFLAASGALAARPALGAGTAGSSATDVVVVGSGAAGIAATRRIAAAGRKFVLIEAADRIGGRCVTDTRTFDVPYDLGAHWIHAPDLNPVTKLTAPRGLEVYPAPASQKVRIGRRYAREGELEDFLALQVRATRAIADAARKGDVACAQALPNDLGEWRPAVEFVLGPFGCGKELTQVSAVDFAKSAEHNTDAFCRQGLGTLIASFAEGDSGQAVDTRDRDRLAPGCHSGNTEGRYHRARCHCHRLDQRDHVRRDQIHSRASQAADRRLRQALARQL